MMSRVSDAKLMIELHVELTISFRIVRLLFPRSIFVHYRMTLTCKLKDSLVALWNELRADLGIFSSRNERNSRRLLTPTEEEEEKKEVFRMREVFYNLNIFRATSPYHTTLTLSRVLKDIHKAIMLGENAFTSRKANSERAKEWKWCNAPGLVASLGRVTGSSGLWSRHYNQLPRSGGHSTTRRCPLSKAQRWHFWAYRSGKYKHCHNNHFLPCPAGATCEEWKQNIYKYFWRLPAVQEYFGW